MLCSVIYAYEDSEEFDVKEMVKQDVIPEFTARAKAACVTGDV